MDLTHDGLVRAAAFAWLTEQVARSGTDVLPYALLLEGFQFQGVPPEEFARNEAELAALLATGTVVPHVGAVYPLEQAAAALRHIADGRAVGKVIVQVAGAPTSPW